MSASLFMWRKRKRTPRATTAAVAAAKSAAVPARAPRADRAAVLPPPVPPAVPEPEALATTMFAAQPVFATDPYVENSAAARQRRVLKESFLQKTLRWKTQSERFTFLLTVTSILPDAAGDHADGYTLQQQAEPAPPNRRPGASADEPRCRWSDGRHRCAPT